VLFFKRGFGFTIWLLRFDHLLIFLYGHLSLRCGAPLVLIGSVAKNVKFEHEVSVFQILSLNEPLIEILTLVNGILSELHTTRLLLTTGCLSVLIILIT